jgi:hypothetical protein
VFCLAGGLAIVCAVIAVSGNEGINREVAATAQERDSLAKRANGALQDPSLGADERMQY